MPALDRSDKNVWDKLWDIQYDINDEVKRGVRDKIKNLPPQWQVAIYSSLIETLAEEMRMPIVLPEWALDEETE